MMELREKIARAAFFRGDEQDEKQWQQHMQERHRVTAYEQADAILAIPEIAEALATCPGCGGHRMTFHAHPCPTYAAEIEKRRTPPSP